MQIADVQIREAAREDESALTELAYEYLSWAIERLRSDRGVEWPAITRDDVAEAIDSYRNGGAILIATVDAAPVGMGALRRLDEGAFEIKRMYVRPAARGHRVGARILDDLLLRARAAEGRVVRLDTIVFMDDAQRLYRSRGFVQRGPYEESEIPTRLQAHWLFFELALR
ncbi:MAG TPA: GNAT family N-acetyltransferase [Actinomycetota bacterium]|nr:GNAT family N-acetyltransferase [Actinomycetota bacterium]